jgi:DNA-binding NarL/FixJ family response regulator
MVRVVLADDHRVVREGLRKILEAEPNLEVIGEAGDGLEVVALVERVRPDVLVVDVRMPGLSGLEVTRQVRDRSPETQVVVLSMYADEAYVLEALRNGALGYVLKESTGSDLVQAVRDAMSGRYYLSPPLSDRAIEFYIRMREPAGAGGYERLTPREREVLHLAVQGLMRGEIASRLSISPRTVETHRANLKRKLGLSSQVDLIRYALRRGIIPMED